MRKKKSKQSYDHGKLPKLWDLLVKLHEKDASVFRDPQVLRDTVARTWSGLSDHTKCPNCNAGMKMYRRNVDYFVVLLIVSMGRIVKSRNNDGSGFTEANQVHVNKEESIPHEARNMTGISSALGLIAPVEGKEAHWAITKRGWDALRGERIQKSVLTFRDQIVDRSTETITFSEISRKKFSQKYEGEYHENEWYFVEGYASGSLF